MEGDGAYNRSSILQAAHADTVMPLLEAAVSRVPVDAAAAPLTSAD